MFPWRVGITYFPSTQSHIVAPSALSRVLGKALFRAPTLVGPRSEILLACPVGATRRDAGCGAERLRTRGPRPKLIRIPIGLLWIGVTLSPISNNIIARHPRTPHTGPTLASAAVQVHAQAPSAKVFSSLCSRTCTAKRRRATSDEDRGGRSSEQAQRSRRWPLCRRERHVWY